MTRTEHLADLFKRLGRGRVDVAEELAEILSKDHNVVEVDVPDVLMSPAQTKRKPKAD